MNHERITLGEEAELLLELAADVNPVLGRHLHKIDVLRRVRHELIQQTAAQTESGARYWVTILFLSHFFPTVPRTWTAN